MELRHLYSFIAVAETGSLRAAARRQHLAQPALGRQMSQLEADVGCALLERVARRASRLTPAGRLLVEEARAIVAHSERAITNVRKAANVTAATKLAVGFLGEGHLPRIHRALLDADLTTSPIELDFFQGTGIEQLTSLRAGRIRAACVDHLTLEGGHFDLSGTAVCSLYRVPFVAILPKTHPLAKNRKVTLAELANQPFVICARAQQPVLHDYIMSQCRVARGTSPQIVQEISGALPAIINSVAAGFDRRMVSLLPQTICWMRIPEVVYRLLHAPALYLEIRLVWRQGDPAFSVLTKRSHRHAGRI